MMLKFWRNRWYKIAVGSLLGAGLGYLYWLEIGCISGSCGITSVWWRSTIYGAFMGGLLLDLFPSPPQKSKG